VNATTSGKFVAILASLGIAAGCGEVARQGRSPAQVVINSLQASAGGEDDMGGFLSSDVITRVDEDDPTSCTIFNDAGQVTMSIILKDPGTPAAAASPSALNQVTFTRYRVVYKRTDRSDGGVPGVDVPYPFESAATFTVPQNGQVSAAFNLVRQTAKLEAPLLALRNSAVLMSMIAEITFVGRDQAGNDVMTTGKIGITFGDFGGAC
jgi:hypothetical protein